MIDLKYFLTTWKVTNTFNSGTDVKDGQRITIVRSTEPGAGPADLAFALPPEPGPGGPQPFGDDDWPKVKDLKYVDGKLTGTATMHDGSENSILITAEPRIHCVRRRPPRSFSADSKAGDSTERVKKPSPA